MQQIVKGALAFVMFKPTVLIFRTRLYNVDKETTNYTG